MQCCKFKKLSIVQTLAPLWQFSIRLQICLCKAHIPTSLEMHPHLTLHRHPMCAEIIEEFQSAMWITPSKNSLVNAQILRLSLIGASGRRKL
ncbi:hypothetical protein ZWY2020_055854 [Hordeum vulgare]|nr:hypothetical protein ZWY2020_055854 [Hordeum vulgare]